MKGTCKSRKAAGIALLAAVLTLTASVPALAEYDPAHGRFLQRDPAGQSPRPQPEFAFDARRGPYRIGSESDPDEHSGFDPARQYADGMNLYEFARSNPTVWVDPSGEIVIGISGFGEAPSTMSPIVSAVKQQVNQTMQHHGFRETRTKVLGGGFFGHTGEVKQLIKEWARRKEKEWQKFGGDCGEQIVIVGHSDGATAIWQVSQDGAHKVRGSNPHGYWHVAYMGMIDMVRPNFGLARPNLERGKFIQPGQARYPTKLDNFYQDTGNFGGWMGYKIGWRPNHLIPNEDHMSIVRNQGLISSLSQRAAQQYHHLYHWHNGHFCSSP